MYALVPDCCFFVFFSGCVRPGELGGHLSPTSMFIVSASCFTTDFVLLFSIGPVSSALCLYHRLFFFIFFFSLLRSRHVPLLLFFFFFLRLPRFPFPYGTYFALYSKALPWVFCSIRKRRTSVLRAALRCYFIFFCLSASLSEFFVITGTEVFPRREVLLFFPASRPTHGNSTLSFRRGIVI